MASMLGVAGSVVFSCVMTVSSFEAPAFAPSFGCSSIPCASMGSMFVDGRTEGVGAAGVAGSASVALGMDKSASVASEMDNLPLLLW
jgi:hypothetical protein